MRALWMLMATFTACYIATSAATNPNVIHLGGSVSHKIIGKRFLRTDKDTNKDEEEAAANDEERIVNKLRGVLGLYSPKMERSTFDKMIVDDAFKAEMFTKWDKFDVSFKKIQARMKPRVNTRFKQILEEYT
ncbi:hypothetical protein PHYBOEH_006100 [Phytophthora boehmeriae]|uniref:RxLR effector protein n=1 Tax=Phytophthora boehmeriae TaxID=109152 RepID=A0A8T1X8G7_9STRA|nr:hypothetical protein PHYBOEH_006100 [Phytophthora boehmeriae]